MIHYPIQTKTQQNIINYQVNIFTTDDSAPASVLHERQEKPQEASSAGS